MRKSLFFKKGLTCIATVLAMQSAQAQWVAKADNLQFQVGRWGGMTTVVNNKIYLTGGYANMQWLNDLQEYDPATSTWKNLTTTPIGPLNRSAGVAFTINGKMYVGLGAENFLSTSGAQKNQKDLWEFTPSTGAWVQKASLPDTGRTGAKVFVLNNKAYIVGGVGQFGTGVYQTNQTWEYDPTANKWTKKADYPTASIANGVAFAINGKGYATCGNVGSDYNKKLYAYDPTTNVWTPKADFIDSATSGSISFVHNNIAYIGLGSRSLYSFTKNFYSYNPSTDKWGMLPAPWPAQTPSRSYAVAEVVGDKAYVGCGWRLDPLPAGQSYFRDWFELDVAKKLTINNNTAENSINVYPNPTSGLISVDVPYNGSYTYIINNITGQQVAKGTLTHTHSINIGNLQAGQYIIELSSEKQTYRSIISLSK